MSLELNNSKKHFQIAQPPSFLASLFHEQKQTTRRQNFIKYITQDLNTSCFADAMYFLFKVVSHI